MRVVFANPACRRPIGDGMERYMMGAGIRFPWSLLKHTDDRPRFAMFPMFLGYAAALAEEAGFTVFAVDAVPLNLSDEEFRTRIAQVKPDVVVMQPNALMIDDTADHLEWIARETGAVNVLIGEHVSAETIDTFDRCPAVDHAVMGEFEWGVLGLLEALRDGRDVSSVNGVATRNDSGALVPADGLADPVEDLDVLPRPARHLFPAWFDTDMGAYHDGFNQLKPTFDMHATRGCPYRCNFCVWVQVLYDDGRHRRRDVADVVDEMVELKDRYGAREIYFDDDNFTAHRGFVKDFCAEIKRRNVDIKWSVLADAIALNDGLLEIMADAGCIGIKFGLDSADAEVLRQTDKPLKVSNIAPLVDMARRLGVKTHMTVVVGLAGETKESLERTFNFACELDIDSIQISMATPVPGTRFYDQLKAEGSLVLDRWDQLDGYSTSVISYDHLTREDLEFFMRDVQSRWLRARLRHPRWVARQARYLARLARVQGIKGTRRRVLRGIQVARGDTRVIGRRRSQSLITPMDAPASVASTEPGSVSVGLGPTRRSSEPSGASIDITAPDVDLVDTASPDDTSERHRVLRF